jgi:hypothetical protein
VRRARWIDRLLFRRPVDPISCIQDGAEYIRRTYGDSDRRPYRSGGRINRSGDRK